MTARLREGFTTGSAATGAALAALHLLRAGCAPGHVDVPLPPFSSGSSASSGPRDAAAAVAADAATDAAIPDAVSDAVSDAASDAATDAAIPDAAPDAVSGAANDATPEHADIPTPRGWLRLEVAVCGHGPAPELAACPEFAPLFVEGGCAQSIGAEGRNGGLRVAHASIRKDGGDDPDATSGALITVTVVENFAMTGQTGVTAAAATGTDAANSPAVSIEGGPGVGRVTLPGLPVPVGEAAVNPTPRQQIAFAMRHGARVFGTGPCPPLRVIVSVPEGERLARQTFNPRLGIVGGISILGTQGTVRPYSHQAWKATIEQGLAVAVATGCRDMGLTTGRRSERLLMDKYPQMPQRSFIQVADFAAFSLKAAGAMPFDNLIWGCFFGKLVKLAQGHAYTHARHAELDMEELARLCRQCGASCADQVGHCVTAAHALELLLQDKAGNDVIALTGEKAAAVAANFAGRHVRLHLFHTDGRELLAL